MSSDSEPSSSDEYIMEEDEEDAEEIHGQIKPYEDEPLADDSEAAAGSEENEETDLDDLAPALLEARYEREIAISSWLV